MLPILALLAAAAWAQTADLAVTGARIYTVDPVRPTAAAIAVKDGRILAMGADAAAHIGPKTRVIDAKGATVIPGLIDSHVHLRGLGESLELLDLRLARSEAAVADLVRRAAVGRKPGDWIRGRGWDQTTFPGQQFPTAASLSAAAPANPVYLTRVDGHAGWVNRKALDLGDVNRATQDPPGGKIIRGKDGKPTGILIDRAQGLVARRIPAAAPGQIRRYLERAARECARLGLTSVHDAGAGAEELEAMRALIRDHKLPVRVYAVIRGTGPLWQSYLERGPETGDLLTVRSIKLVADGALGSRGAAMIEPYSDDPGNNGLLILSREEIERVAREAVAKGFQVNTHAIGDRANRVVLEAYAAALGGKNDRRFRVEHAQIVALDDIPLFAKYSIIASMQATHATSDMRWAEARVGPERIAGAYAWRRFLKLGVPVANGSDFPVEAANPMLGFYASVTRQDGAGSPAGGWQPGQRMTREEALKSWTLDGAFAAFEEAQKGSLQPGKFGDFLLLSHDIMTAAAQEILKARVRMTVLGGEVVYQE
jgi:hypothetical protein